MFNHQDEAEDMLHKILKDQEIQKKNRKKEVHRQMRELTSYINSTVLNK